MRARGLAALEKALGETKLFGGTSVLLVPAVVNKQVSYDEAYTRSQAEIRKAIPVAEETGVKIALENVWNNFLVSPLETARYIDELQSPMVAFSTWATSCATAGPSSGSGSWGPGCSSSTSRNTA